MRARVGLRATSFMVAVGAVLALGAGFAVFPSCAEASTRTAESTPSVATSLTLLAPKVCAAKESTRVTAVLTDASSTPVAGATVTIERLMTSGVSFVASGTTDASGRFSTRVAPQSRLRLVARFAGSDGYLAGQSETVTILPKVLLSAPWTHGRIAYPGQRLPARGSLWPRHSASSTGTVIVCERWEDGQWVKRKQYKARIVNTATKSRYDAVVKLPSAGTWRVRAVHVDGSHARTLGPVTKIKVTDWRRRYVGRKLGGFKTSQKMVAITIDDGPNSRTLEICSILEKYGARGTFFFIDKLLKRGYGPQAKKAYDRGHEIANHTANHKMLTGSYSFSWSEVMPAKRTILSATGFAPTWVRAMGGGINSTGLRAVANSDQLYCNWSVDSYDSHRRYTPPNTLYRNVVNGVRSGDVILIHQTHPETIAALPAICRELKRRGYKMVTLSELAAQGTRR